MKTMTFIDVTQEKPQKVPQKQAEPQKPTSNGTDEQWGYDLYPERRSGSKVSKSLTDYIVGRAGREELRKINCERGVYRCIKESPLMKLMVGAMKAAGCPFDIRRHISCEECAPNVSGGYDPQLNQVVVCYNNAFKPKQIHPVLTHEFVHMYDFCKNNLDFRNLDHLACTEIRAANLAHCSFVSAWLNDDTSIFNFKATHQNCVKSKALSSMLAVRKITKLEAIDAIERVFTRCYNDLEPLGRRIRRNSDDMRKAYEEGFYYGYDAGF